MNNKENLINENKDNDNNVNLFEKLYKIQKLLKKESALKELCNSIININKYNCHKYSYKNV